MTSLGGILGHVFYGMPPYSFYTDIHDIHDTHDMHVKMLVESTPSVPKSHCLPVYPGAQEQE